MDSCREHAEQIQAANTQNPYSHSNLKVYMENLPPQMWKICPCLPCRSTQTPDQRGLLLEALLACIALGREVPTQKRGKR